MWVYVCMYVCASAHLCCFGGFPSRVACVAGGSGRLAGADAGAGAGAECSRGAADFSGDRRLSLCCGRGAEDAAGRRGVWLFFAADVAHGEGASGGEGWMAGFRS